VRVPDETHRLLGDLVAVLGRNRGQVIETALPALAGTLSGEERKALEALWRVRQGAKIRSKKIV
jgi:outer membrane lipoprotein SlyB